MTLSTETVKGFKVFNSDWTCRGFQYEVGKSYTHEGYFKPCDAGFHFCEKLVDCFEYYPFEKGSLNRVAIVEALGEVKTEGDKSCTNHIRIVSEINWQDVLDAVNQGKGNTGRGNAGDSNAGDSNAGDSNAGNRNAGNRNAGHYNAGDSNAGNRNAGHYNAGDSNAGDSNAGDSNAGDSNAGNRNAGHYNAGNRNAGNRNAGHYNAGDSNAGDSNAGDSNAGDSNAGDSNAGDSNAGNRNAGHYNAGYFNSCNYSSGDFCTVEPPYILFNKPSPVSREDVQNSRAWYICRQLRVVDGEGNKIDYKTAWANLWADLNNSQKITVQSLPNFDAAIWYELTGITV